VDHKAARQEKEWVRRVMRAHAEGNEDEALGELLRGGSGPTEDDVSTRTLRQHHGIPAPRINLPLGWGPPHDAEAIQANQKAITFRRRSLVCTVLAGAGVAWGCVASLSSPLSDFSAAGRAWTIAAAVCGMAWGLLALTVLLYTDGTRSWAALSSGRRRWASLAVLPGSLLLGVVALVGLVLGVTLLLGFLFGGRDQKG
jgi:hypothetical protein